MFTQATAQNSRQVPRQVKEKLSLYIKEAVMSLWRGKRLQRQYITAVPSQETIACEADKARPFNPNTSHLSESFGRDFL